MTQLSKQIPLSHKEESAATLIAYRMIQKSGHYAAKYQAMTLQIWCSKVYRKENSEETRKNLIFWMKVYYCLQRYEHGLD